MQDDKMPEGPEYMPLSDITEVEDELEETKSPLVSPHAGQSSHSSSFGIDSSNRDQVFSWPQKQQHFLSSIPYRQHTSALRTIITLAVFFTLFVLLSIATTFTFIATGALVDLFPEQFLNRPPTAVNSQPSYSSINPTATSSKPHLPARINCQQGSDSGGSDQDCIFDPIMLAWLPKACINFAMLNATLNTSSALAQEPYNIAGDFQVFTDPDLQRPVSFDEVALMKQNPYYVTLGFHRAHCAYIFRLVSDAARKKGAAAADETAEAQTETEDKGAVYVWRESLLPVHVEHCAKVLASRKGDLGNPEKFWAARGECVLLT